MEREQPNSHWHDFTAQLSDQEHRRLVVALGAGLREARKAAEAAYDNGRLEDVVTSLDLAISWLTQAQQAIVSHRDGREDFP